MRKVALPVFLLLAILVLSFLSLWLGVTSLTPKQVWMGLTGQGDALTQVIVQEVRLPRTLLALLIGAGLGGSGAALQGYTRNDLAAPGLLGFSACAALGAVIALYFGFRDWITPAAIFGALIGAIVISALALRGGQEGTGPSLGSGRLILAGIGIGALATALTGLIMNLAPNPWALSEIVYWMMGSLDKAHIGQVWVCAVMTVAGLVLLTVTGAHLKTLSLGEDTAQSLGVNLRLTQFAVIIGTALCVGSGVAVAGAIGFIGLFIPHIMRFLTGPDPAKLIPVSALAGGLFLLITDTAIRIFNGPGTPLYLGVVTALIGVPFFLYLAVRTH